MNNIDYLYSKDRVLDFSNCKYLGEVHELIKKELELPEFYGCNLDALWDAVTGLMYVPANIKIIFTLENVVHFLEFKRLKSTVCKLKNTTPSPVSLCY